MRPRCGGLSLGLMALAALVAAVPVGGAEQLGKVTCLVTDEDGRPIEDVKVRVCGEQKMLPDGSWDRNHTPHCLMPQPIMDKAGRFTVPFHQQETRLDLWVDKEGFAPAFVAGLRPQTQEVKVVLKRGRQVSGHVQRLVNGKPEPVPRAAVYLGCSSGDAAHQKRVFEDPYFFVMEMKEGDDLPYLQHVLTGAFGEYVFQVSPPPKDKKWFVVCLGELVPLEVEQGQPTKGPDFQITVQAR